MNDQKILEASTSQCCRNFRKRVVNVIRVEPMGLRSQNLGKPGPSELRRTGNAHASQLWGFKSEGGLEPNAYTHALFADFDLAGQK